MPDPPGGDAAAAVERLADEIEQEWLFKLRRLPENVIVRLGSVWVVLLFLEALLIISNNVRHLGLWDRFVVVSTSYREAFRQTGFARVTHLDSDALVPWHLWRGWVVPAFLAGSAYVLTGIVYLRYELYTWRPELLEHFFEQALASPLGRRIPRSWLRWLFNVYTDKHRRYSSGRLQPTRKHKALQDATQFLHMLRAVAFNVTLAVVGVLLLWLALLRSGIDATNIARLPRSYVPPVQGIVWYLFNDFFYFYPHWIAHTPARGTGAAAWARLLPAPVAEVLHSRLNSWHKPHHQTKANLGIAAWYCSPWEQVFFNLFPAFVGPVATQALAKRLGIADVWGTHLVVLYVWLVAAASSSVLAHTGYRSRWNDPGKHDLHHELAMHPTKAVNFGTLGFFDWLHGTRSSVPKAEARRWRAQRDRQAALLEASRRKRIPLTAEQMNVVKQPKHGEEIAKMFD